MEQRGPQIYRVGSLGFSSLLKLSLDEEGRVLTSRLGNATLKRLNATRRVSSVMPAIPMDGGGVSQSPVQYGEIGPRQLLLRHHVVRLAREEVDVGVPVHRPHLDQHHPCNCIDTSCLVAFSYSHVAL